MTKAIKKTAKKALTIASYTSAINQAFDSRSAYETEKNANNTNIQKTLADMQKHFSNETLTKVFLSANVDSDFINRNERSNAKFNVYAAQKVINAVKASASAATLNHYSKAILASAVKLAEHDMLLNHKDAVSACSLDCKQSDAKRESLIVKYQSHVAANTASTQSSSSINALQACNVLIEKRDDSNTICYELSKSAIAKKLIALAIA